MPSFAEKDAWSRLASIAPDQAFITLDPDKNELSRALQLDPALSYGICQFDLARGPVFIDGKLPHSFWSVAIAARDGRVIYSTTSRAGSGDEVKIGVFNPAQSRLLAEEGLEIGQGFLIVNAPTDQLTASCVFGPNMRPCGHALTMHLAKSAAAMMLLFKDFGFFWCVIIHIFIAGLERG